jgi:type IV secretion system protein VirB5
MTRRHSTIGVLAAGGLCALLLASAPAMATIPVIDVAALGQLVKQVSAWQQQLAAMQQQLDQLRVASTAITGNRGLQDLLPVSTALRNYLPPDWASLAAVYNGTGSGYASLQASVRQQLVANMVLSPGDLARFPAAVQAELAAERNTIAGNQAVMRAAYANESSRFAELQTLISTIGSTHDLKAIDELTARIGAEQSMLLNESAKLASLAQVAASENAAREIRRRELVVAGHGSFATRFQPTFPAE